MTNTLPLGWFTNENIQTYRRLMSMVPNDANVAELGTWIGRSLCSVSDIVKDKNIKVTAVDTFGGTANERLDDSVAYAKSMDVHAEFLKNIKNHGIADNVNTLKMSTDDAVKSIEDEFFDFVFVDAEHTYEAVKRDIENWLPKVKKNGIIAGHDYNNNDHPGVVKAVAETIGDNVKEESGIWIHRKGNGSIEVKESVHLPVTCVIPTKDRLLTTLPVAIASVVNQTRPPKNLIIMDDGEHKDPRYLPLYDQMFKMIMDKGIQWYFLYGERKGLAVQHTNSLRFVLNELVWRVDDDDMPECNVLETLYKTCTPDVGAVGSSVLFPDMNVNPAQCSSMIDDIYEKPNLQWSRFSGVREVDHLNNTFLYRKSAARGYPEPLSPVSHREDTIWSYGIKMAGYRVLVNGDCITWHLRQPNGGIRAYSQQEMYDSDEKVFRRFLDSFKKDPQKPKIIVLDNGLGDHLMFRQILPEIKEKYAGQKIIIAACYPEVFEDDGVELISIQQAKDLGIDMDRHNVYEFGMKNNWKDSLIDAFRRLHL